MVRINPSIQSSYAGNIPRASSRLSTNTSHVVNENENENDASGSVQSSNPSKSSIDAIRSPQLIVKYQASRNNPGSNGRSTNHQPPTTQYQINDQLLQREALGSLVGIDVFA